MQQQKKSAKNLYHSSVKLLEESGEIRKELESELNKNKWISVSDRLPETNCMGMNRVLRHIVHEQTVIVSSYQEVLKYNKADGFPVRVIGGYEEKVTHWREITPPKGE